MASNNFDDLLTPDEAAAILGRDVSLVRRYCREGRIRAVKPGRDWLISKDALQEFAKEPRYPGNPEFQKR